MPTLTTVDVDGLTIPIEGECAEGHGRIVDAFAENFRERRELGAQYTLYREGRRVVDLWAGHRDADRQVPAGADTLFSTASCVKGMMAFALHMLVERGRLDLDQPVARYWPAFAQSGKQQITVRQAISHHAALHFADAARPGDFFRYQALVDAVAAQRPEWPAGTRGVYHTITIFPILAELIRCASGSMVDEFFRREVTTALGVDYHVRMKPEELGRYAPDLDNTAFIAGIQAAPDVVARFFKPIGDPTALTPELMMSGPYLPGGTARGMARLFAFAAMGGQVDGVRVLSPGTIDRMAEAQWHEPCAVWGTPMKTALGLLVNDGEFFTVGPNPRAFGTAGGGGSIAVADRENGIAFAYTLNRWWPALALGDRAAALVKATYEVL